MHSVNTHGFEITDVGRLCHTLERINPVNHGSNRAVMFDAATSSAWFIDECGDRYDLKNLPIAAIAGKCGQLVFSSELLLSVLTHRRDRDAVVATIIGGDKTPCLVEFDGDDPVDVTIVMPIKLTDLTIEQRAHT